MAQDLVVGVGSKSTLHKKQQAGLRDTIVHLGKTHTRYCARTSGSAHATTSSPARDKPPSRTTATMPQQHILQKIILFLNTFSFLYLHVLLFVNADSISNHPNLHGSYLQANYGRTKDEQGLHPNSCRMRSTTNPLASQQMHQGYNTKLHYTQLWITNKLTIWVDTKGNNPHTHVQDLHSLLQHPTLAPKGSRSQRQTHNPRKQPQSRKERADRQQKIRSHALHTVTESGSCYTTPTKPPKQPQLSKVRADRQQTIRSHGLHNDAESGSSYKASTKPQTKATPAIITRRLKSVSIANIQPHCRLHLRRGPEAKLTEQQSKRGHTTNKNPTSCQNLHIHTKRGGIRQHPQHTHRERRHHHKNNHKRREAEAASRVPQQKHPKLTQLTTHQAQQQRRPPTTNFRSTASATKLSQLTSHQEEQHRRSSTTTL